MADEATTTEAPAAAETEELAEEDEEEEEDLDQLKEEIARMEAEAERLDKETAELKKEKPAAAGNAAANSNKPKSDATSIYVGQVDYSTTPEELLKHFSGCGTVERVTIVCDKYSGRPKGFAYLEFDTEQAVATALKLDGSEFKSRNLKVTPKRVNEPSFMRGGAGRGGRGGRGGRFGRGRGRGGGRGRYGGGYHPYY